MKKIVITGGPYAGKSSVINALQAKGHLCVDEAGIQVFDQLNEAYGIEGQIQWRETHVSEFQNLVIKQQSLNESKIQELDVPYAFLDRGQHDSFVYAQLSGAQLSDDFISLLEKREYSQVFLLDVLLPFDIRAETGRNVNYENACMIGSKLKSAYELFGYKVTVVPQFSIEERMQYILERLL